MATEACPLCELPRPAGALKCRCNYVFEYERPVRTREVGRRRGGKTDNLGAMLGAIATVAGVVAGIFVAGEPSAARQSPWLAVFLIGAGAFSVAGAFAAWSWFLGSRRARLFVMLFGKSGARVIYALLGGALAGAGVGMLLT